MTVSAPERIQLRAQETGNQKSASESRLDLYELLFHPGVFRIGPCLIGIFIGLVACSLAGFIASKTNFYKNFHRFHEFISPATLYYPTVSQMVSIVESKSRPNQTIVIIGGNSIFNGIGQQVSELWTDRLGQSLGDHYAVFNFASPGSMPFEGGYWTAETLLARGRKVIFVTVAVTTQGGTPDGEPIYGYLYWDAREKNMLAPSIERDSVIQRRLSVGSERERTRVDETILASRLDRLFYFRDLWSAVGYLKLFTVWTEPTAQNPFKPRFKYGDWQPYTVPVEKRFGNPGELATIRSSGDSFFDIAPTSWKLKESALNGLRTQLEELIPSQFKKNCLVIIAGRPPYYLNRIGSDARARVLQSDTRSKQAWLAAGYHCDLVGERLADEDYRDCMHMVGSGGAKVAKLVAANVQQIDKELNYQGGDGK